MLQACQGSTQHARCEFTFGLPCDTLQAKRTAKCVALSHCDLCVLNSMDLKLVMKVGKATLMEAITG
jgi:hypothetical protein